MPPERLRSDRSPRPGARHHLTIDCGSDDDHLSIDVVSPRENRKLRSFGGSAPSRRVRCLQEHGPRRVPAKPSSTLTVLRFLGMPRRTHRADLVADPLSMAGKGRPTIRVAGSPGRRPELSLLVRDSKSELDGELVGKRRRRANPPSHRGALTASFRPGATSDDFALPARQHRPIGREGRQAACT